MKTKSKVEITVKEGNVYFFFPNLWKENLLNFIHLFKHIKNIK